MNTFEAIMGDNLHVIVNISMVCIFYLVFYLHLSFFFFDLSCY